ncbi:hypothetical protein IFM89_035565 [Coptis chinensis]|uniref:DUF3444 domain-containing protein n=1 Tax=Coptis chinensis TaxID=261450 RepID=A0A835HZS9_9MAGN|nr:hypothetical protein IFM89_035565 [Coptis chinensis]
MDSWNKVMSSTPLSFSDLGERESDLCTSVVSHSLSISSTLLFYKLLPINKEEANRIIGVAEDEMGSNIALEGQTVFLGRGKRKAMEKHMPAQKRLLRFYLETGSDEDEIIEKGEERCVFTAEIVRRHCPHCSGVLDDDEYVVTRKKSRESGSLNVFNDQSEALSKGLDVGAHALLGCSAGFGKDREKNLMNLNHRVGVLKKKGNEKPIIKHSAEISVIGNKENSESKSVAVPHSNFYQFDKDRNEGSFEKDQIWAVYDTHGMPRLYARIRRVFSPGFKLEIAWLDAKPDHFDQMIDWISSKLPVSCGKFKYGKTRISDVINIFSHIVKSAKSTNRGSFEIYPRKGETWALFKNWDVKWSSDPDNRRNYEVDFVEILSDYEEGSGVIVAYLEKVKGFVSLFRPKRGMASFQIPPREIYKFSHMSPSYKTTGKERDGLSEGYFELDPASVPDKIEEFLDPEDVEVDTERMEQARPGQDRPTFWTGCPSCNMKFQYYNDMLNKALRCVMCLKIFIANDLNLQGVPSGIPRTHPVVPQQREASQDGRITRLRHAVLDITSDGGFQRHNAGTSTTVNRCSKSKGKGKGKAVVGGSGKIQNESSKVMKIVRFCVEEENVVDTPVRMTRSRKGIDLVVFSPLPNAKKKTKRGRKKDGNDDSTAVVLSESISEAPVRMTRSRRGTDLVDLSPSPVARKKTKGGRKLISRS